MSKVEVGKKVPDFELPATGDTKFRVSKMKGKIVVLYFYPKDNTPGCTTEAIDFTAALDDFDAAGAVVIGVSKDSVESHDKFKKKHGLKVILGSDPDRKVIEAYGAWGEKSMYGKTYEGIIRSSFLIGEDGKIIDAWYKVSPKDTVPKAMNALS